MKTMKKSIIGMSIGLGCTYGSVILFLIAICVFFGTLGSDIYGFMTDTGLSGASISLFILIFVGLILAFGGLLTAFGFWIAGILALVKTDLKWYAWIDGCVFLMCLMLLESPGFVLTPIPWWIAHFVGYQMMANGTGMEKMD